MRCLFSRFGIEGIACAQYREQTVLSDINTPMSRICWVTWDEMVSKGLNIAWFSHRRMILRKTIDKLRHISRHVLLFLKANLGIFYPPPAIQDVCQSWLAQLVHLASLFPANIKLAFQASAFNPAVKI